MNYPRQSLDKETRWNHDKMENDVILRKDETSPNDQWRITLPWWINSR